MKKIIFLINNLDKGGAEKILSNIANYISKDDCKVTVCYFGNQIYYEFSDKINLIKISKIKFNIFKTIKELKKILNDHGSNNKTIISHLNYANYYNIILSFFTRHKPVVVLHSSLTYYIHSEKINKYLNYYIHYIIQKILYRFSFKSIAVSSDIQNFYQKTMNLNSKLIYNPTFDINFKYKSNFNPFIKKKINIIIVGSLIQIKNHLELFDCIKNYLLDFCNANDVFFTIIGDGPLKNYLSKYVIKNNIDHLVGFIGIVDEISEYYYNCDLLVSTSKLEGLPTVIIEAITYQKPVISSFQQSSYEIMSKNLNNFYNDSIKIKTERLILNTGMMYELGNLRQLSECIIQSITNYKNMTIPNDIRNKILSKFSTDNYKKYLEINK